MRKPEEIKEILTKSLKLKTVPENPLNSKK